MAVSEIIYLVLGFILGLYVGSGSFREKVNSFLIRSKKTTANKDKDEEKS